MLYKFAILKYGILKMELGIDEKIIRRDKWKLKESPYLTNMGM